MKGPGVLRVVTEGAWIGLSGLAGLAGGFLFWFIAGGLLPPSEIGYATTAFSVAGLAAGLLNMGLGVAVMREASVSGRESYSTSLAMASALGVAAMAATYFSPSLYPGLGYYMPVASVAAFLSLVNLVSTSALIAAQRARVFTLVNGLGVVVKIASLVALVRALPAGGGLWVLVSITLSLAAMAAASTYYAVRSIGLSRPSLGQAAALVKLGLSNYPAVLASLFVSGGIVMLGVLTGDPAGVGSFYIAVMAMLAAGSLPGGVAVALLPALTRASNPRLGDEALRLALAVAALVALPLAAYPDRVLSLLGGGYLAASPPLSVLAWGVVPLVALQTAYSRANSERDFKRLASASAGRLVVLVASMAITVPRLGPLGAAASYLASVAVSLALITKAREARRIVAPLASMAAAVLASKAITWLDWVASLAVLESMALALLVASRSIRASDVRLVASALLSSRRRA